jgi:2-C-methyl-D-erythritol 2,4-cyclodiphosphate synthase
LTDHKEFIRSRLARALGIAVMDMNVKAKTNEGMGWVGRGEGIACVAIATLAAV